jgi:predicted DNA-binding transcriptional regulator YafY
MRKVTGNTLAHLIGAMDAGRQVTIRYVKPVKGGVEISRRRIEIHAIEVTGDGNIVIQCYDHRSRDRHTFRLDRVTHYTLHRSFGHTVPTVMEDEVIRSVDPRTGDADVITGFRAWDFAYQLVA